MRCSSTLNIAVAPPTGLPTKSERELWEAYGDEKNEATTTGLIRHYHGLVVSLARARLKSLPDSVPLQDIVAAGMAGLYDAIGKFRVSKGVPFVSYASIRIRGAILDWLRLSGPAPRSMASRKIEYVEISKFDDTLMSTKRSGEDIEADKDEVRALLARLRKEENRILTMHFLDGFRQIELAAIYGVAEVAVYLRIKHALAKIRAFVGV